MDGMRKSVCSLNLEHQSINPAYLKFKHMKRIIIHINILLILILLTSFDDEKENNLILNFYEDSFFYC